MDGARKLGLLLLNLPERGHGQIDLSLHLIDFACLLSQLQIHGVELLLKVLQSQELPHHFVLERIRYGCHLLDDLGVFWWCRGGGIG